MFLRALVNLYTSTVLATVLLVNSNSTVVDYRIPRFLRAMRAVPNATLPPTSYGYVDRIL